MSDRVSEIVGLWNAEIAPRFSFPRQVSLSPIPEGYSTEVFEVDAGETDDRWVLRVYPRGKRARLRGYLQANRVFSRLGIRVPQIHATGKKHDLHWIVEERIEGTGYHRLLDDRDAVGQAAVTLARLHSHTRNRYGPVSGWGGFRLTLRWRQRFPDRWRKITRLFPELEEVTDSLFSWFREWSESYSPRTYQLLHNDFHPGNLIRTQTGDVALLDLRSPRFGLGLVELIEASHSFAGEDLPDWTPFLEPYQNQMAGTFSETFEKHAEGCHAVFHLRQTDRFADLALGKRGTLVDRRRWEENAWDCWTRFCGITGLVSPVLDLPRSSAFQRSRS